MLQLFNSLGWRESRTFLRLSAAWQITAKSGYRRGCWRARASTLINFYATASYNYSEQYLTDAKRMS